MATIYNSDLLKGMQEDASLQVSQGIPTQLAEKIVPVMETNPNLLRKTNFFSDFSRTTTGTSIVAATFSSTVDTYVTGVHVQNQTDSAADNTTILLYVSTEKGNSYLYRANKISLTAFNVDTYIQFRDPIKVTRGSTAAFSNGFSVGVSTSSVQIFGYTVEIPRA